MKNYIFLLIPLCLAFPPNQVLGNCARPTNYYITVENYTVAVADYCATAGKNARALAAAGLANASSFAIGFLLPTTI